MVTFALDYFTRLHQNRRGGNAPEGIRGMGVQYSPSAAATTRGTTSNSLLRPDQNHSEEDESMHSDDDIHNYGKYHIVLIRNFNRNVQNLSIKWIKI